MQRLIPLSTPRKYATNTSKPPQRVHLRWLQTRRCSDGWSGLEMRRSRMEYAASGAQMPGKQLGWRDSRPLHEALLTACCASEGREPQAAALHRAVRSASNSAQARHVIDACSQCREVRTGSQTRARRRQSLTGGPPCAIRGARRMAGSPHAERGIT